MSESEIICQRGVTVYLQSQLLKSKRECLFLIVMQHSKLQPRDWWYVDRRPANDNAYFENMSRVIFQAGLKWKAVDKKWSIIRKVFANFDINKVAGFSDENIDVILKEIGMRKNRAKINAVVTNAIRFQIIQKMFGSFQLYIDSLDKTNNYEVAINDLTSKFENICHFSASHYFRTVGEKVTPL